MSNPEMPGCPIYNSEQEKKKVNDAVIIQKLTDKLMAGESITLEDYPYDEEALSRLEGLFTAVTGTTFDGEVASASEATTEERLDAFRLLSQELTEIASRGIPALTTACYVAEVHHMLKHPELISSPQLGEQEADPVSIADIYEPSLQLLGNTHRRVYEECIDPLIPDEVPGAAKITSEVGKMGLGLPILKTALVTFADDAEAYQEALLAMPRRHQITAAEEPEQNPAEFATSIGKARITTIDNQSPENIEYVNAFARQRQGNYIDQTILFILGSTVLRREGYTPRETEAIIANSLSAIGRLAHYTYNTMPGNFARPDICDNPHESFNALLEYTKYLSVDTEDDLPRLSIAPLPLPEVPPYNDLAPDARQELEKEGRSGGRCPARIAISCSDEMQYFIDKARASGYNLGSDYTATNKVKLSTFSTLLAFMSAQENKLFERLEQYPPFQEAIHITEEDAESVHSVAK